MFLNFLARKMTLNNHKAEKEIYNHIISKYNTIKVESGKCRYNYRCQMNSVHEAKKNKHKKLAMCVCEQNGGIFIHFINYHKGKFIDNTLGQWSKQQNYYFIKWIKDEDMWGINHIFTSFREELRNNLSWWVKLTSDFEA